MGGDRCLVLRGRDGAGAERNDATNGRRVRVWTSYIPPPPFPSRVGRSGIAAPPTLLRLAPDACCCDGVQGHGTASPWCAPTLFTMPHLSSFCPRLTTRAPFAIGLVLTVCFPVCNRTNLCTDVGNLAPPQVKRQRRSGNGHSTTARRGQDQYLVS